MKRYGLRMWLTALAAVWVLASCGDGGASEPSPQAVASAPTAVVAQALPSATAVPPTVTAIVAPTPLPTATPAPVPTATAAPAAVPTVAPAPSVVAESRREEFADAAFAFLETLTYEYSPRESATEEELAAAVFLQEKLEELGYETRLQDFPVVDLISTAQVTSGGFGEDGVVESRYIASSLEGAARGTLEYAGLAFEDDIPPDGLEGKVALIERGIITFEEKVRRVSDAGAKAAIIYNNAPGNFNGRLLNPSTIPAVSVSREDGRRLMEALSEGHVKANVSVSEQPRPSRNLIAEKRGEAADGGTVIVGAHYDTTPGTQGANDNGSGVAVLMTMAEEMADVSYPFAVRFILFGSEEIGLIGSGHYVGELSDAEIEDIILMLNFDVPGSGRAIVLEGSAGLGREALGVAEGLGIRIRSGSVLPPGAMSDHTPFDMAGVPALFVAADDLSRINSPADTIEYVNPGLLGQAVEFGLGMLEAVGER